MSIANVLRSSGGWHLLCVRRVCVPFNVFFYLNTIETRRTTQYVDVPLLMPLQGLKKASSCPQVRSGEALTLHRNVVCSTPPGREIVGDVEKKQKGQIPWTPFSCSRNEGVPSKCPGVSKRDETAHQLQTFQTACGPPNLISYHFICSNPHHSIPSHGTSYQIIQYESNT